MYVNWFEIYQPFLLVEYIETELTKPSEIINEIKELPPKERKGSVIPVTGKIPMFIPIFINM